MERARQAFIIAMGSMKSTQFIFALFLFAAAACFLPGGRERAAGEPVRLQTDRESSWTDAGGERHISQVGTGDAGTALFLQSPEGEAVSGPRLSPRALIFLGLVSLGIFFLSQHLYLFAQHWRLRAVVEERGRLAHEMHDTVAQSFAGTVGIPKRKCSS